PTLPATPTRPEWVGGPGLCRGRDPAACRLAVVPRRTGEGEPDRQGRAERRHDRGRGTAGPARHRREYGTEPRAGRGRRAAGLCFDPAAGGGRRRRRRRAVAGRLLGGRAGRVARAGGRRDEPVPRALATAVPDPGPAAAVRPGRGGFADAVPGVRGGRRPGGG